MSKKGLRILSIFALVFVLLFTVFLAVMMFVGVWTGGGAILGLTVGFGAIGIGLFIAVRVIKRKHDKALAESGDETVIKQKPKYDDTDLVDLE